VRRSTRLAADTPHAKIDITISVDTQHLTREEVRSLIDTAADRAMHAMEGLPYAPIHISRIKRVGR
jgi:hypothetical protein